MTHLLRNKCTNILVAGGVTGDKSSENNLMNLVALAEAVGLVGGIGLGERDILQICDISGWLAVVILHFRDCGVGHLFVGRPTKRWVGGWRMG